jgi:hypothetical protein
LDSSARPCSAKAGLYLLLQELNAFLFLLRLAARTFRRLDGGRSVLEKLSLPAVEHRRLQFQFFTQIGNRTLSKRWRRGMATFFSAA